MQKAMERIQCFQDCVRRHYHDEHYECGDIQWFSLPFADVCAETQKTSSTLTQKTSSTLTHKTSCTLIHKTSCTLTQHMSSTLETQKCRKDYCPCIIIIARRRSLNYRRKVDPTTRCSSTSSHTYSDLIGTPIEIGQIIILIP